MKLNISHSRNMIRSIRNSRVTYYMGDMVTQEKMIRGQIDEMNRAIKAKHALTAKGSDAPPLLFDANQAVGRMRNRVGKFYGMRSKYDSRGNPQVPIKA